MSKGAEEWSKMNDAQKAPYNEMYEKAKAEYNSKLQAMVSFHRHGYIYIVFHYFNAVF